MFLHAPLCCIRLHSALFHPPSAVFLLWSLSIIMTVSFEQRSSTQDLGVVFVLANTDWPRSSRRYVHSLRFRNLFFHRELFLLWTLSSHHDQTSFETSSILVTFSCGCLDAQAHAIFPHTRSTFQADLLLRLPPFPHCLPSASFQVLYICSLRRLAVDDFDCRCLDATRITACSAHTTATFGMRHIDLHVSTFSIRGAYAVATDFDFLVSMLHATRSNCVSAGSLSNFTIMSSHIPTQVDEAMPSTFDISISPVDFLRTVVRVPFFLSPDEHVAHM